MPSLGNPANTLTVFGGATLQFISVGSPMNKALLLKDGAVVNNNAGDNTYASAVNLQGIALFNVGGSSLTFTNVLSGTGGLSKVTGTAPLTLTASNTYTGNTLVNAGTLSLTEPGDIRASQVITLSASGTLDVSGRADQTMTLLSGHSLAGRGTINGNLVAPAGSTVAPGADLGTLGTLNVNGSVTLGGATVMRLNKNTLASDMLSASALTFGGSLVLTNVTGTLAPGDSFTIFSGGGTGSFASIVPATPGNKLTWDTSNLNSSGIISVLGPPSITNFTVSGSSITLQGAFGTAFGQYTVVTTTDVTRPANQWTPLATNFFDGSGNFEFITNITTLPQQYFMLRVP
jgi:autotransporter-associated beta strand protein